MKPLAILLSLFLALGLLLSFFLFADNASASVQSDLGVAEMDLAYQGEAFEIDLDANGNLWISEYKKEELWQINPATSVYTIYPALGSPSDAHADSNGNIWWADTKNSRISRLSPKSKSVTSWDWNLPENSYLYGLQVESPEKIWVTDAELPYVYQLDLSSSQHCTYIIPENGSSGYPLFKNGKLWSGDWINKRIYRLDPDLKQYTFWQLPYNSLPEGLTFDFGGNLWYSNSGFGKLERLDPDTGLLSRYTIPSGFGILPELVTWIGGYLWYGEVWLGTIGRLDPVAASNITMTLSSQTVPINPQCDPFQTSDPVNVNPTTGTTSFTDATYPAVMDEDGWLIYQLPSSPHTAQPWGIAYREGDAWFVDFGRQKLIRIPDVPKKASQIVVQKQTQPDGSPQSFEFESSFSPHFFLTDGEEYASGSLLEGVYSVNEVNLPLHWEMIGATCDDDSSPQAIDLQDGETITCVFTNRYQRRVYLPSLFYK